MDAKMLDGKVAIITGASYGMGRTMAELFAEEGASVVITARGKEKLDDVVKAINDKGGKAVGVVADTCSTEDTKRVFDTALREFGDVDILINNAGIGEQKLIDDTDDEWMLYVMNTNLGGPMRYIREALKIFLPKNDGVIINISSVNGTRPFCGATYTSTKGALNTLTKNVAMRLVDTNILVDHYQNRVPFAEPAELLRSTAAGLRAAGWIPAAGEAAPEIGGRGDLFLDTANRRIAWVNFAPGGIGSFYVGTY